MADDKRDKFLAAVCGQGYPQSLVEEAYDGGLTSDQLDAIFASLGKDCQRITIKDAMRTYLEAKKTTVDVPSPKPESEPEVEDKE